MLAWTAGLVLLWLFWTVPPPLWYRWRFPGETAFMAMRRSDNPEGATARRYQPVPLEQIPANLRRAVLLGEDHRFYEHGGLDLVELRRAIGYPRQEFQWGNPRDRADLGRALRTLWSRRDDVRGASTITQQLARNLYLSPRRTPGRKLKELVTTWRLELWLPKDRILELYLNTVELGDEVWGVEAAARRYFGKSVTRLTDREAATLAATLPFPRTSNPIRQPGRMLWRRDHLLRQMQRRPALPVITASTSPTEMGAGPER